MALTKVGQGGIEDDAVDIAQIKSGSDGELISYDASGNPVKIAAGTAGHFLKSQGDASQPVFAAITQSGGDTSLELNDDAKVVLGTGDEGELYHNTAGVTVLRNNVDAKDMHIQVKQNSDIIFDANDGGNHKAAVFKFSDDATPVSSAELYQNNTKKFETTADGVTVTGRIDPAADSTHDIGTTGVRFANGYFDTLYGDGSNLTNLPAGGATINNATNDEIVTVASDTSQLDAESTLLYDGGLSRLTMKPGDGHTDIVRIVPNDDTEKCHIVFQNAADNDEEAYFGYNHELNQFRFKTNSSNYRGMFIDGMGRISNGTGTDPQGNGDPDTSPGGCAVTEHGYTGVFGIQNNSNSHAYGDSKFGVLLHGNMNGYNNTESASMVGINYDNGATDPGDYVRIYRNSSLKFRINKNGDVKNDNNSYGSTSDETLKQDIVDAGSQWNDVKAVKVRKFKFKADVKEAADLNASSDNDRTDITAPTLLGVIAQELETAGMNGLVDQDVDKKTPKAVKYSVLYMKAFKALQEAMAKIETLETKVAALEAK
tara:strand:+ start:1123 stop:2748 length:1626 start_codon:yes stop_codon:yes gene_type:complete